METYRKSVVGIFWSQTIVNRKNVFISFEKKIKMPNNNLICTLCFYTHGQISAFRGTKVAFNILLQPTPSLVLYKDRQSVRRVFSVIVGNFIAICIVLVFCMRLCQTVIRKVTRIPCPFQPLCALSALVKGQVLCHFATCQTFQGTRETVLQFSRCFPPHVPCQMLVLKSCWVYSLQPSRLEAPASARSPRIWEPSTQSSRHRNLEPQGGGT